MTDPERSCTTADQAGLAAAARTSLDLARVGILVTYPRARAESSSMRAVDLAARPDGSVVLRVERNSVSVAELACRPIASVHVAPHRGVPVVIHGDAARERTADRSGLLAFRVTPVSVRVGGVLVHVSAYAAARPDPLRHEAVDVLTHLNEHRRDDLTACVRAQGRDAIFAEATALDSTGITVLAVGGSGVEQVRLVFRSPVHRVSDTEPCLRALLVCDGRCS